MLKAGRVGSVTVTLKVQLFVLPLESVAVQVTVVSPTGKLLPLGGRQVRLVTAQLSLAAGTGQLTTCVQLLVRFVTTLPGQLIAGFWVSLMVSATALELTLAVAS